MSAFLLGVAIFIGLLIAANFHRVAVGPTVYDRLVGVGVVGVNAVLLLVLLGVLFERTDMFIDLAIAYALLNFISLIAVAKYLEPGDGNRR